jgi:AbiTii-like protein
VTSLVLELQKNCLDRSVAALEIMRKALVVARKLSATDFQRWIELEMQGYKPGEEIPDYRVVKGEIKAWNPYRGWIDTHFGDPEMQRLLSRRAIGQPIGQIETVLRNADSVLLVPFDAKTEHDLMEASALPLKPSLHVSVAAVEGILDKVRDVVLNWCLDLESKGILGEGITFSEKDKQNAAGNYTVHYYGAVGTSQIQQGTVHSSQECRRSSSLML